MICYLTPLILGLTTPFLIAFTGCYEVTASYPDEHRDSFIYIGARGIPPRKIFGVGETRLGSHHPARDRRERHPLYILLYSVIIPGVIVGLMATLLQAFFLPERFGALTFINSLYLIIFLCGWGCMIAGLFYLVGNLGAGIHFSYVLVSLIVILLNTTVFYINPLISAVQHNHILRQWVIKIAVNINPMLIIASNFFGHDPLRFREMYSICDIGPYYFYSYAHWCTILVFYIIIGVLSFAISRLLSGK
ncbi:MAG: hypothetical protein QME51_04915 [Planctomycetota bacterium]|nr:hypothetical protein [Planctomycetota bacterium]MDI6787692.1 hypothetical protein [Planctomycetota bacterium]